MSIFAGNFGLSHLGSTAVKGLKERETKKIGSLIADFSYHKETDTYLLSCEEAKSIYSYNASSNELKKLKEFNDYASAVEFMSPSYYAFSIQNKELCVGTLENGKIWTIHSKDKSPYYLQSLNKSRLLLATLEDGTVMVYRTNKLPKMPVFCSVKGHYVSFSFVRIQNAMVNGKEIVITIEKGLVLHTFSENYFSKFQNFFFGSEILKKFSESFVNFSKMTEIYGPSHL